MSKPWVEKYRPTVLDDIVGNNDAINQFKSMAEKGNIPHMLLSGKPGTGKTTSVICLAKKLLGNEFDEAFLELNASDERGIDVIRNKITMFCKKKITLPDGICKIIFLDEFDSMTTVAQQALRRIIEMYTNTTRFVMACNGVSNIIEAIQSRCSLIRFGQIDNESMEKRLLEICKLEGISEDNYNKNAIKIICEMSNGDMRKALNNIQSAYVTYGKITENEIDQILINMPKDNIIYDMINYCFDKNLDKANELLCNLLNDGFSNIDILKSIFNIIKDYNMDVNVKTSIFDIIANTEIILINGGDSHIQLLGLLSRIILLIE